MSSIATISLSVATSQFCTAMRILAFCTPFATCGIANANPNPSPVDVPTDHIEDNLLTRWKKPIYPWSAFRDGITGEVTIEFDTDNYGGLTNVRVVSSKPTGVFDDALIKTLNWWTVVPFRAARCFPSFPRTRITVNFGIENGNQKVVALRPVPLTDPAAASSRVATSSPNANASSPKSTDRGNDVGNLVRLKHSPKPDYPLGDNRLYPIPGDVVALITFKPDGGVSKIQIILSAPHPAFGKEVEIVVKSWVVESKSGEPLELDTTICMPFRFRSAE